MPPTAMPTPLAEYQRPMRIGCSFRVYHMPIMIMTDGSKHASAAPDNALKAANVLKFFETACNMSNAPLVSFKVSSLCP